MELSLVSACEKPTDSVVADAAVTAARVVGPKPKRKHVRTKPQLLTRAEIDHRSNAAKLFDNMVSAIAADLGGRDQLTAMELALVEAFAGESVTLNNLNTRLLLGEKINLSEQALAVSAMVRVASRLGLQRRAKDVGSKPPTAEEYFAFKQRQKEQANGAPKPDEVCP